MKPGYLSKLLITAVLIAATAIAVACSSGDDNDNSGSTATATTAAKTFPAGSTMAQIVQKGKITIGVKYDVPLFGQLDPVTRKLDGIDVFLGKAIAAELGLKEDQIEFIEAISANRIPYLQEDKADLIISTMTINEDRKTQIDFSRPYYLAGQSILVKSDNTTIKSVTDLNGKKVCSVAGSTSEKNIQTMAPQAELLSLTVYSACVTAMKDGRVDAVSTDDIILAGFAASDTTLKLVGGQFTQEAYGIGMKKGKTDLQALINDLLTKMLADGRWEAMYKKYLGNVTGLPSAVDLKAKLPATP